jgi:hypothetical protein
MARYDSGSMDRFYRLPVALLEHPMTKPLDCIVYAVLRNAAERIRIGKLKHMPGERSLAQKIGGSRNGVRGSLQRLAAAGFVTREPGARGASCGYVLTESDTPDTPPTGTPRVPPTGTKKDHQPVPKRTGTKRDRSQKVPPPVSKGTTSGTPQVPYIDLDHKTNTPLPPKAGKRRSKKTKPESETVFPESLQTDAFRETWSDWERHRIEIGKRLTPTTVGRQLRKLEKIGHDDAIRSIDQSISNGWTGLFEPRSDNRSTASRDRQEASRYRGPTAEPDGEVLGPFEG